MRWIRHLRGAECGVKTLPDDHFIITAYYTDTVKRGEVLWEKK